jgi:hypothetical protein
MKPVEFKHQNIVFAKDQPEYQPLPALRIDSPTGEVISCWKLSFNERVKIVFTGRVWLSLTSFNKPLTPTYLAVNRKEVYSHPDDNITMKNKLQKLFPFIPILGIFLTLFTDPEYTGLLILKIFFVSRLLQAIYLIFLVYLIFW